MKECPTPDLLRQFLDDELSSAASAEIDRHVGKCAKCEGLLAQWVEEGDGEHWRRLLRDALDDSGVEVGESADPLRHSVERCGPVAVFSHPIGVEITFPGPITERGPLGKLGPYLVVEEIGRGASAIVYRAVDERLRRTVALKVLRPGTSDGDEAVRFMREARAAVAVEHPNVITIHDVGGPPDFPLAYIAMEFVDGESLAERLEREGAIPARAAAQIARQVALGLDVAGTQGLVHRDVKPANILLDASTGDAKLGDFGIARVTRATEWASISASTTAARVFGSPAYMSPEQIRTPQQVDARSDVYSLGVVLYEMLTGSVPFRGTIQRVWEQIIHDEPIAASKLDDRIPRDLETIAARAMAKEPTHRFATAKAISEDLERFLLGQPIAARPFGGLERFWYWSKRHPALAMASSVAAIAVFAVAVLSMAFAMRQSALLNDVGIEQTNTKKALNQVIAEQALTKKALGVVESQRTDAQLRLARLSLQRGQDELAAHRPDEAILWMVRALSTLQAQDPELEDTIRANIAASRARLHTLKAVFRFPPEVEALALSLDGRFMITNGPDKSAQLWDVAAREPIGRPIQHPARVCSAAFSPDGSQLVTGCEDSIARIWGVPTGLAVATPMSHDKNAVNKGERILVSFSPDGSSLLTCSRDKTARLWSVSDGSPIGEPMRHDDIVTSARFGTDGTSIVTASMDRTVRFWNAADGKPIGSPITQQQAIESAHLSVDGKTLITITPGIGIVRLWRMPSGQQIGRLFQHDYPAWCLGFTADGSGVMTTKLEGDIVWTWSTENAQLIGVPQRHERVIPSLLSHPKGRDLLVKHPDGAYRIWSNPPSRNLWGPIKLKDKIWDLKFSPNQQYLLITGRMITAHIVDVATGVAKISPLKHPAPFVYGIFSPNGENVLTSCFDQTARLWTTRDGARVGKDLPHDRVLNFAFSPDGKIVQTCAKTTVSFWRTQTGEPLDWPGLSELAIKSAAFSRDGRMVATATEREVLLWSAFDGSRWRSAMPHDGTVHSMEFSADGERLLIRMTDRKLRLCDTQTGHFVGDALVHDVDLAFVAFISNGKSILTIDKQGSSYLWNASDGSLKSKTTRNEIGAIVSVKQDGSAFLVSRSDGSARLIKTFEGNDNPLILQHDGPVRFCAFSPNKSLIATVSDDYAIRLWNTADGSLLGTPLRYSEKPNLVAITPDESGLVVGCDEGTVECLRIPERIDGDAERLTRWAQVVTGKGLGTDDVVHLLDEEAWLAQKEKLELLGGNALGR